MKIGNVSGNISSADYKVQDNGAKKTTSNSETHKVIKDTAKVENLNIHIIDGKDEFNDEVIIKSINQANKSLKQSNRFIERTVHEVTKSVMYTVKDINTNEVIAEFPPKKIQDMVAKMWELAGLFIDEKG